MKARSRHPLRTEAIALLKRLPLWQRVVLAGSCAVLLLVSAAFLLPSTWLIQRSVLIAAPPARIYSLISDLRWWPRWTIWNRDLLLKLIASVALHSTSLIVALNH